jgi:predicted esterase
MTPARVQHLHTRRTARYATLGEPGAMVREVWIVCHGYGQLAARFLRRFQVLADPSRLIVAPEALNRYYIGDPPGAHGPATRVGATWMTHEDRLHEIDDYVHYLDTLYDRIFEELDRGRVLVHAFGFSQGVATVSRWAAQGTAQLDRLTLWAAMPPPDLDLGRAASRLRETRVTLVVGAADPYAGPTQLAAASERLQTHGIPPESLIFTGGHEIDAETLIELAAGGGCQEIP